MPNERLRAAMLRRRITPDKLAEHVGVDPKTVERWIVKGREPYRRHRYTIAAFLGVEEVYLWPDALTRDQVAAASESEIVAVYPHRFELPRDVLQSFFAEAESEIGILVYAGLFLSEDARLQRTLADRANAGVRIRMLFGDPDSREVAERGNDEGIGDAIAAKIKNVLALYKPLHALDGVEFRFHRTVLLAGQAALPRPGRAPESKSVGRRPLLLVVRMRPGAGSAPLEAGSAPRSRL
jgi:hypothetical protein